MTKNIHWILIPQAVLILLILDIMSILDRTEEVIYVGVFVFVYVVSLLYFHLIGFIFKSRPKLTAKGRKDLISRLYKIYSVVGISSIVLVLFSYIQQWNQTTLVYLSTSVLLLIPLVYFLVRLSLYIVEKNRIK